MGDPYDLLWKPLLEASAQVIVGAIGGYAFKQALDRLTHKRKFDGPMDLWKRGIGMGGASEGDQVYIDGLISPYFQLFPGNPFENGKQWNKLYDVEKKISSQEYQTLDFLYGSDAALRVGSINGETLVGIFARYGYIGEGLIGVAPTKMITAKIKHFFHPRYFGERVIIGGRIARCPTQYSHIAQAIAIRSGVNVDISDITSLYYVQINSLELFNSSMDKVCSLIGSPWAVTSAKKAQYILQYGYFDNQSEIDTCISRMKQEPSWEDARVFFDDLSLPSQELSYKKAFIV